MLESGEYFSGDSGRKGVILKRYVSICK